jgi:hypothetical protein
MTDYTELCGRLRNRHLLGDCVEAADAIEALVAEVANRDLLINAALDAKNLVMDERDEWKQMASQNLDSRLRALSKNNELRAELREAVDLAKDVIDQTRQGLFVSHDCPAVYACSYLLNEAESFLAKHAASGTPPKESGT